MRGCYNEKVALVTGAASGIGLATARAFAAEGASVALADRDKENVRSAAAELMKKLPIARLAEPGEIASAAIWLCGPGASCVIGHALVVGGGYTIH